MAGLLPKDAHTRIGTLTETNQVLCDKCRGNHSGSALFVVNVFPYSQTCHGCRAILCPGQSPLWCELFPPV